MKKSKNLLQTELELWTWTAIIECSYAKLELLSFSLCYHNTLNGTAQLTLNWVGSFSEENYSNVKRYNFVLFSTDRFMHFDKLDVNYNWYESLIRKIRFDINHSSIVNHLYSNFSTGKNNPFIVDLF